MNFTQTAKKAVLAVVHQGYQIIFDDSDDEEIVGVEKIDNFAEETVPRFGNRQFKEHFRMKPETFEDFLQKLHAVSNERVIVGKPEIFIEKQAMITLWYLANMESFRSVSDRFGITKSTCWSVLYRTCFKILELNKNFKIIVWPSRERSLSIMEAFQAVNGFEGVIGCIDGTHVKILPPKDHPNSYCNRKNFHSILLQGVCDNRKLFTHVYTGEPGSIHDNRLFEKSDLYEDIENGEITFPNNSHILGDLAYKLTEYLIVGFKNNGFLTDRQRNFNIKLSQIRVTIENAFALLKGRFRRLKFIETVRLDLISLLIISSCILHNLCILNGDETDDIMNIQQELEEERQQNNEDALENRGNNLAVAKRTGIMNRLDMAEIV